MRSGILAAVGVALAGASLPAAAATGPSLGAARSFAALGGSTLTNTGATTTIVGDVGVSPGSAITGITQSQVTGGIYVGGTAKADQAHSDAALAYAFLKGMASDTNLTSTDLGGLTLAPGVYTFNSSAALTGAMFLNAGGDPKAVFVFQIGTSFTTANGSSVTVINGGANFDNSNIFWQVGSSATLGTTTALLGTIIADQSVTLQTGATLTGSALAINGAASLDSNAVTSPPVQTPVVTIKAPINLTAVLTGLSGSPEADLSWNDASNNETEFRVYRREGAAPVFTLLGTVLSTDMAGTGGVFTYQDLLLTPSTTYTYKVTAFGLPIGESLYSNEALVDTGVVVPMVLAPLNLTAALSGNSSTPGADLSWTDVSSNETEFRVYRRDSAGPDFVQVGTVPSTDMAGTEGLVTFNDPLLDVSTTLTYRVTAFSLTDGESAPSNEALIETGIAPPVRWLAVHLGRGPSIIKENKRAHGDRIILKGSYAVIDVASGVPVVLNDADPRTDGISIQVRAPGNLVLISIPANDTNWRVSKNGVYRWRSHDKGHGPISFVRIDTRKSEFRLMSRRSDFGPILLNAVTVSLSCQGATGSETRAWKHPKNHRGGSRSVFTLPE